MIVTGASAYALAIDWKRFRAIADSVGAYLMSDIAHYAGLVAVGLYPTPVGIADFVTTTTHKTLRGPRGGLILAGAQHEKALNSAIFPSTQGGPLMHVIAAKAVAFKEALQPEFKDYQQQVLDNAQDHGGGAAGARSAHRLRAHRLPPVPGRPAAPRRSPARTPKPRWAAPTSRSTRTRSRTIRRSRWSPAASASVRRRSPRAASARPRRAQLANLIADVLEAPNDEAVLNRVAGEVKAVCAKFPVYA